MATTMTIRLEDDVKERLDVLANATQRSKSFLAAEAIRAFVETNATSVPRRPSLRSQERNEWPARLGGFAAEPVRLAEYACRRF